MSEARKYQIQTRARRLPQSLEKAVGVLVQAIIFALFLASFIAASKCIAISIDSVQSLQHKKLVSLGVKRMPSNGELLAGRDCLSAWRNPHFMRAIMPISLE